MFLVIGAVLNMGAYWFSDKIALKMSRAQPHLGDRMRRAFTRSFASLPTRPGCRCRSST